MTNTSIRSALRLSLAVGIVSASVSAHAWIIALQGTYTNPNTNMENLTVLNEWNTLFGAPAITSISYSYTGVANSGKATFALPGKAFDVDFSGNTVFAGGTHSFSGIWNATQIAGVDTKATGTYSASFDGISAWSWTFVGQPVPEPSTIAGLTLGLGVILARRRRR